MRTKSPGPRTVALRATTLPPPANAATVNNGNAGVGSTSHLACTLLNQRLGVSPTLVPYRGTGPAIQDLVAGNVGYICDQVTSLMSQVQGGTITPLGASTAWPVIADASIPGRRISMGAGRHGMALSLDADPLLQALAAQVADISEPQ